MTQMMGSNLRPWRACGSQRGVQRCCLGIGDKISEVWWEGGMLEEKYIWGNKVMAKTDFRRVKMSIKGRKNPPQSIRGNSSSRIVH